MHQSEINKSDSYLNNDNNNNNNTLHLLFLFFHVTFFFLLFHNKIIGYINESEDKTTKTNSGQLLFPIYNLNIYKSFGAPSIIFVYSA